MKKLAVYTLLLFVSALAFSSCKAGQSPEYTSELERLDEVLEQADEYVRIKEQKIATIGNMLNSRGVSPLQQYQIYGQLYEEYKAYQFDKAKEMLASGYLQIKEISNMLGFASPQYFSSAFKSYYGKTPLDYRAEVHIQNKEGFLV